LSTECIVLFVNSQRQLFHFSRLLYFISTPPLFPFTEVGAGFRVTNRVVFCVGILGAIGAAHAGIGLEEGISVLCFEAR